MVSSVGPSQDLAALRCLVVEQVMRLTDNDAVVHRWLRAGPRSVEARVALGRLLADAPFCLEPDSPVALWTGPVRLGGGMQLADGWRDQLPDRAGTLWHELCRLEAAHPHRCPDPVCRCSPYVRLAAAREAAEN